MPKRLVNLSISSPGFFGLNKQLEGSVLPPGWASEATNVVFDEAGRMASRKGYKNRLSSNPTGTPRAIHEYIDGAGNSVVLFATNNAIYKDDNDGTFTDVSGTITTPTADNWQFTNFNGKCVGFQSGHAPIVMSTTGGSFANITLSGTQQPTTAANNVTAAFGRLWTIDGTDLKYSDLLIEGAWNGVFDLSSYWREGMDEGVAVAEYNGYLLVFGKDNTIVYSNPYDPASTMQIVENIGGIGCVARDSIQDIGTDLLFLSRTGIRSLGRTIQEKSMPVRDISKHIKDYILGKYFIENSPIKSVYDSEGGFYAISFPDSNTTFVFDLKSPMQDGSLRATEWSIAPTAFEYTLGSTLYMGFLTRVAEYTGYKDDVDRDGSGGDTYQMIWSGTWNDFGEEARDFIKIPKKLAVLMGGVAGRTVSVKWGFDYIDVFNKTDISFPAGTVARYGVAQYTLDIYSGVLSFNYAKSPLTASGQVIKFGVEVSVNGDEIVLQRIDLSSKIGRYFL
jgi:hypothetical protein